MGPHIPLVETPPAGAEDAGGATYEDCFAVEDAFMEDIHGIVRLLTAGARLELCIGIGGSELAIPQLELIPAGGFMGVLDSGTGGTTGELDII